MYNMPARKKPVKKPKKKVTQKQKQAQKQVVNIVIGAKSRSKKRGVPRQSAAGSLPQPVRSAEPDDTEQPD
jgi:hypothetical protein